MTDASTLSGADLDLAVANAVNAWEWHDGYYNAEIFNEAMCFLVPIEKNDGVLLWSPSTDWSIGGPLIERERVTIAPMFKKIDGWSALIESGGVQAVAATPLIAAMRAIVKKYSGDAA
jgi:Protein of unknown function (DUF2591)